MTESAVISKKNKKLKMSNDVAVAPKNYSIRESKILCVVLSGLMEELKFNESCFWDNQSVNRFTYEQKPEDLTTESFEYTLDIGEFRELMGGITSNNTSSLLETAQDIQRKALCTFEDNEGNMNSLMVFPLVQIKKSQKEISFYVSAKIFALYFDVIGKYALLNSGEVSHFKSTYTFALYSYMKGVINNKKIYSKEKPFKFYWTTKETKRQFNLEDDAYCYIEKDTGKQKFARAHFEKKTLLKALEEINSFTEFNMEMEKEKDEEGKVKKYWFKVWQKDVNPNAELEEKDI